MDNETVSSSWSLPWGSAAHFTASIVVQLLTRLDSMVSLLVITAAINDIIHRALTTFNNPSRLIKTHRPRSL